MCCFAPIISDYIVPTQYPCILLYIYILCLLYHCSVYHIKSLSTLVILHFITVCIYTHTHTHTSIQVKCCKINFDKVKMSVIWIEWIETNMVGRYHNFICTLRLGHQALFVTLHNIFIADTLLLARNLII